MLLNFGNLPVVYPKHPKFTLKSSIISGRNALDFGKKCARFRERGCAKHCPSLTIPKITLIFTLKLPQKLPEIHPEIALKLL